MAILFIVSVLLFFLTADLVVATLQRHRFHRRMGKAVEEDAQAWHIQTVPEGTLAHATHTWVAKEESGDLRLGVDGFAGAILGGVDRVVPCLAKGTVNEGEPLAVVSGNGRSITLVAPMDVEILGVNEALSASAVGTDPLGAGWLFRVRARRTPSAGALWRGKESLRRWWREEFLRLREAAIAASHGDEVVGASLPDGGVPVSGAFTHLDPVAFADLLRSTFGSQAPHASPAPLALRTERAPS